MQNKDEKKDVDNNRHYYNPNQLSCICGQFLWMTLPCIYGPTASVYCNICLRKFRSYEIIHHCDNANDIRHPNAYDLCDSCSRNNITASVTFSDLLNVFKNSKENQTVLLPVLYSKRESYSSKISILLKEKANPDIALQKLSKLQHHRHDSFPFNKEMNEILSLYGKLFGEIFNNPSLLSTIFYTGNYKILDSKVKLLTETLLPNPYNQTHEFIFQKIVSDVIDYEFHQTKDLTTFLRENTSATKLFSAYLKREPIAIFINNIVEEACNQCLIEYKENLDINPKTMLQDDLNQIEDRKAKLIQYVDLILARIMIPSQYPMGLRVMCRKLHDLGMLKSTRSSNTRLKNSLVGGFIFLRIFNPNIVIFAHKKAMEEPYKKYGGNLRRKCTLISKIMQAISNQIDSGMKEKWMNTMNEYIVSKYDDVSRFFDELCDVPLQHYFRLHSNIIHNYAQNESIYISTKELLLFTNRIHDHYKIILNETDVDNEFHQFCILLAQIFYKCSILSKNESSQFIQVVIPRCSKNNMRTDIKSKLVEIFNVLKDKYELICKDEKFQKDGLLNVMNILQWAKLMDVGIENIQQIENMLMECKTQMIAEKILLRLYVEKRLSMDMFNLLNQEINDLIKYQKTLQQFVTKDTKYSL
eukprot:175511_1